MSETPPTPFPPIYAPPPKRTNTVLWVLLAIAGVVMLLVCGGVIAFGQWAQKQASKEITLPPNGGKPQVLSRAADGWVTVHFPEGPLTVELPYEPQFSPADGEWDKSDRMTFDHVVNYYGPGDEVEDAPYWYSVGGVWLTPMGMMGSTKPREFAAEYESGAKITGVKELDIALPGDGLVHAGTQSVDGVEVEIVLLYVKHSRGYWSMQFLGDDADYTAIKRIAKSIKQ